MYYMVDVPTVELHFGMVFILATFLDVRRVIKEMKR